MATPSQGKEATPMVTPNPSWKLAPELNAFNKPLLPHIAILGVKLPTHKFWGETSNHKQKYILHKCYKASTEHHSRNNPKTHMSKQPADRLTHLPLCSLYTQQIKDPPPSLSHFTRHTVNTFISETILERGDLYMVTEQEWPPLNTARVFL